MNPLILNYSQCIKQEAHWGYDKWHNICTGTWNTVNWGSMDWTSHLMFGVFFGAILLTITGMFYSMIAADRVQQKMMEKFAF